MHFRPAARFRTGILFLSSYDDADTYAPVHLRLLQANGGVLQCLDN